MLTHNLNKYLKLQWVMLSLALLLTGTYGAAQLAFEYRTIELQERDRLSSQARVIDDNMVRQLEAGSAALVSVLADWQLLMSLPDGQQRMSSRLQALSDAMPGVRTLLILDREGDVLSSNREELVGRNFASRDYVVAARQRPDPDLLFVSPPFETVLGVHALNLTRVGVGVDGETSFIATATLDPDFFGILLESVRYAPDMWVAMAHGDGAMFHHAPPREELLGADLSRPGSLFSRHVDSGERVTLLEGIVATTGVASLMAQRTIWPESLRMDKPLIVAAARGRSEIFAGWRNETIVFLSLWGMMAVVSIVGMWLYQRRQHQLIRLIVEQEALRRRAEEEIAQLAFYDSLTALPNRRLLLDRIQKLNAASKRRGRFSALLFIDVDNFKRLNDQYGHDLGDRFLTSLAKHMISCVREEDTVARLGGDEFVVMLAELSAEMDEAAVQARVVAEKILHLFKQGRLDGDPDHVCSASIGIALFGPREETVDSILKRADDAMYRVKSQGRNGIQLFEELDGGTDANPP